MSLFKNKPVLKYYFLRKRNGTYHVEKIKKTSEPKESINFNEQTYHIDLKAPLFVFNTTICYFMDIETGNQLIFDQIESQLNAKDLDIIVSQKIIKELTKGVMDNKKDKFFAFLGGIAVGALIMAIILVMYYNGKIQDVYTDYIKDITNPTIVPV